MVIVWHGVYFVKQGLFAGGIFKFIIEFPLLYPNQKPKVRFTSPVNHPLVNPSDHEVNLNLEFKEWQAGKHWLINVLLYIKKLFHLETMYNLASETDAYDRNALQTYKNDFTQYIQICKKCVEQSQDLKYTNHPGSMIKLTKHEPVHDKIIEKIKSTSSEEMETWEAKDELKNWLFSNFDQVIAAHNTD